MLSIKPELTRFEELATRFNRIPLHCAVLSDQLTPVSAFQRLARQAPHAFLLESVVGGEKIARYSFIGADPSAVLSATGRRISLQGYGAGCETVQSESADPLGNLQQLLSEYRCARLPELPRFVGGAVGYAGYDVIRYYEDLPHPPPDDRSLPDMLFGIYDTMVIFDHVKKLIRVVAHASVGSNDTRGAYADAVRRIEQTIKVLESPAPAACTALGVDSQEPPSYSSNLERSEFEGRVDRCREYIRAGDIFQVVISQRLCVNTRTDPFDIYRALRVVNPSPFMFYLKSPAVTLVGSSPEILCRVEDGVVTSRPLAGTRPRGRTEAEDVALERELLADPKERAEHVMLVDLGRNDVGRVSARGSVRLSEVMTIERYSHVMHICSNVAGRLAAGKTAFDALRAVLPVGTVSGAPKIRAMQIIDELETTRRGPYAGAVGYIDFAGNMDTCIALRTLVITPGPNGQDRVYAQVGAGIVADSEPSAEYNETLNKARSMLQAINVAESWSTA